MFKQGVLAMSEMSNQHQEKQGCDGLLSESMQRYCDPVASS